MILQVWPSPPNGIQRLFQLRKPHANARWIQNQFIYTLSAFYSEWQHPPHRHRHREKSNKLIISENMTYWEPRRWCFCSLGGSLNSVWKLFSRERVTNQKTQSITYLEWNKMRCQRELVQPQQALYWTRLWSQICEITDCWLISGGDMVRKRPK